MFIVNFVPSPEVKFFTEHAECTYQDAEINKEQTKGQTDRQLIQMIDFPILRD